MIERTPALETLPQRGNGIWDYISPSRLSLWIKCPLAFKARYIDGITTPTTPSLFVGKRVHAALESWYRQRMLRIPPDTHEVVEQIDQVWDVFVADEEMTFKDSAEETRLKRQTINLVSIYLHTLPTDEPQPLAVESRWELPLVDPQTGEDLGIPLLGFIDLVLDDPGGAQVIDFKTAATASAPVDISHELQLTSYAYLLRTGTGSAEGELQIRSLIKTKSPTVAIHRYRPREDRHFRRLFALIREYLNALDRGVFNFRPGWTCSSCDLRESVCAGWGE
jgi:putative RecB family exonuclease